MPTHQLEHNTVEATDTNVQIPTTLDSPQTKLVYLYLATVEAGTVEDIRDALGVELITLYPVLNTLMETGLVGRDGSFYACTDN